MKKSIFYLAMFFVGSNACSGPSSDAANNTAAQQDTSLNDTTQMRIQIPESACYRYATAHDTIFLKVERFPTVVTGILEYSLKEKDRNTGDIDGVLRGDTLVADYKFMSEGSISVRQVVFLLKGDEAIEGYGKMRDEGGKMVFADIGNIDFSKGTNLGKIPCAGR